MSQTTVSAFPASAYRLRREQNIPRPLEEVFAFFANAANLQKLTPAWLHFRILTPMPMEMRPGALIDYTIRLWGIPVRWTTEIISYDPPHSFADVQRRGPYKLWHHTHRFEECAGGTRMIDEVVYQVRMGILGRWAHAIKVRNDLKKIFDYRRQEVEKLWPPNANVKSAGVNLHG